MGDGKGKRLTLGCRRWNVERCVCVGGGVQYCNIMQDAHDYQSGQNKRVD